MKKMNKVFKKAMALALMTIVAATGLTGCGLAETITIDVKSNDKATINVVAGYDEDGIREMAKFTAQLSGSFGGEEVKLSEEEIDKMVAEMKSELKTFKKDGKVYYGDKEKIANKKNAEISKYLTGEKTAKATASVSAQAGSSKKQTGLFTEVYLSADTFYGVPNNAAYKVKLDKNEKEQLSSEMLNSLAGLKLDMEFKVKFEKPVVKTNGKLSADKKTVTWNYKQLVEGKKLYATTKKSTKKLKVNIKNNKTYKKSVTVKATSGKGSMYLDGKLIASGKAVKKAGKHTLVTVSQNGTKATYKFVIKK